MINFVAATHVTEDATRTEHVVVNGQIVGTIDQLKAGGFRSWVDGDAETHRCLDEAVARIGA